VQESRDRVRTAIVNSRSEVPTRRSTDNLAPADVRKEGPAFDLPIALALLCATGQSRCALTGAAAVGELGLDGAVRPVAGVLAVAQSARRRGLRTLLVPSANAREAALVTGLDVLPAATLREAAALLAGAAGATVEPPDAEQLLRATQTADPDLSDVLGQAGVKRVLEVAVAGAHNLLMVGPPGSGKTMLARRVPSIMPPLSVDESIDVTRIYSVAGMLAGDVSLVVRRPFRAPHHTISAVGLVGGGSTPRPGEVSLAHHGVLFLDEFPEFRASALEGLRQPLEDGEITISRALQSLTFPARIMLVAAMNPCPCGFYGDKGRHCTCPAHRLAQYGQRLSGPLLDRIDLRIDVPRLTPRDRRALAQGEPSAVVRQRVAAARLRQRGRLAAFGASANAHLGARALRELCVLEPAARSELDNAYETLRLSARACDRVTKVAQTIADLEGSDTIAVRHVRESLSYREQSWRRG